MNEFGVASPLCSYVQITVNGEPWGLYLAVEGVEDSFLRRNYGTDHGDLYKPDSLSFGGGRGNGMEFNMDDFMNSLEDSQSEQGRPSFGWGNPSSGGGFDPSSILGGMGGMFGMGSSDVKLQYIDDNASSYSNIFSSAKTPVAQTDEERLIQALKNLSTGEDPSASVDIEQVIRYFVVHNFVVNGDSYTGSMIHNYYLYEENGQLSMIPWDYNLAFGTFQGGSGTSSVNDPIDSPLSVTGNDRPIIDWIFSGEEYTQLYHQYFAQFLKQIDFADMIDTTAALIAPYVEQDATAFYAYEQFQQGVSVLREFCLLREESIAGQLEGTIPSTDAGQNADSSSLIDASHLALSDMGSMGGGFGGGGRGERPSSGNSERPSGSGSSGEPQRPDSSQKPNTGDGPQFPNMGDGSQMPSMGDGSQFPSMGSRHSPSEGTSSSGSFRDNMQIPGGFTGQMPGGSGNTFPGSSSSLSGAGSPPAPILISLVVLAIGLIVAAIYRRR